MWILSTLFVFFFIFVMCVGFLSCVYVVCMAIMLAFFFGFLLFFCGGVFVLCRCRGFKTCFVVCLFRAFFDCG